MTLTKELTLLLGELVESYADPEYESHYPLIDKEYIPKILALLDTYCEQREVEARAKLDLAYKKFKKLDAAIFAVMFHLDKPYPDDPRWTPYTRFVGPRLKMLQAAFKGEDIGDLEGMARVGHQPKVETCVRDNKGFGLEGGHQPSSPEQKGKL